MGAQFHPLLLGSGAGASTLRGQPLLIHQTQQQPRMMPQLPPMAQFELDSMFISYYVEVISSVVITVEPLLRGQDIEMKYTFFSKASSY